MSADLCGDGAWHLVLDVGRCYQQRTSSGGLVSGESSTSPAAASWECLPTNSEDMALDQSALLELLDVMRSADGGDLTRRLLATIRQLLVDAEATSFIGAKRDPGAPADPALS